MKILTYVIYLFTFGICVFFVKTTIKSGLDPILSKLVILCILISLFIYFKSFIKKTVENNKNESVKKLIQQDSFTIAEIMAYSFFSSLACVTLLSYYQKSDFLLSLVLATFISLITVFFMYKEDTNKMSIIKRFSIILDSLIYNFIPAILISLIIYIRDNHTIINNLTTEMINGNLNNSNYFNKIKDIDTEIVLIVNNIFFILILLFAILLIAYLIKIYIINKNPNDS